MVQIGCKSVKPVAFTIAKVKPEYPGDIDALQEYIANNIKYPKIAKEKGIEGRVYVQFVIDTKGRVTKVKVVKGVDPHLNKEAIRVVKTMPNWIPGEYGGKKVPVSFIVPVSFKLNKD
jgi:protein TonB